MKCDPRTISGSNPILAIRLDYNRYCGLITGDSLPGGAPLPPIPSELPSVLWDAANKDAGIILSNSDRDATSTATGWRSVRSVDGIEPTATEIVYFELHQPGVTVGFQGGIGFADETESLASFVGSSTAGAMHTPIDGNVYTGGVPVVLIGSVQGGSGSLCGAFDPTTRGVWFGVGGPPDTSLPAQVTLTGTGKVYLACSTSGNSVVGRISAVPRQWVYRADPELLSMVAINGAIPTITKKIAAFGDSITMTVSGSSLGDKPQHLYQEANGDESISSGNAVQGRTAAQGDSGYAAMVTPMYDATLDCTLVTWLGTNDIFFSQSQTGNATAALASIVAKAKAEGWSSQFIGNIIQRGDVDVGHGGTIADWRTDADTINAWISANDTDYAEMLFRETDDNWRWETAPFVGNGPAAIYIDSAHPTSEGYQLFLPAIDSAL